jgi:hypothetical protein
MLGADIRSLTALARTTGSLGRLSAELTATTTEISLVVVPVPAGVALAGAAIVTAACALRRRTRVWYHKESI